MPEIREKRLDRSISKIVPKYSICMCGAEAVGKTAIFSRVKDIVDGRTPSVEIPTYPGIDTLKYSLSGLKEENVTIVLFDPPVGMTGNSIVTLSNYYRGAACVILVYDVTDWNSLNELISIYEVIRNREYCPNAKYVILRNKMDMIKTTQTCISCNEEQNYILERAPDFHKKYHGSFDTSAETNSGIEKFFLEDLVDVLKYVEPVRPEIKVDNFDKAMGKKSCC